MAAAKTGSSGNRVICAQRKRRSDAICTVLGTDPSRRIHAGAHQNEFGEQHAEQSQDQNMMRNRQDQIEHGPLGLFLERGAIFDRHPGLGHAFGRQPHRGLFRHFGARHDRRNGVLGQIALPALGGIHRAQLAA